MNIDFVTPRCARLHGESAPVVLGISPFNSYFSEQVIAEIANWASAAGCDYYLYIPDGPSIFTLRAMGYEANKAIRKARRQCNYLENKIYKALGKLGQTDEEITLRVLNSGRLDGDSVYRRILAQVYDLWQKNEAFKQGCISTAHWVLRNQRRQQYVLSNEALELAARYFLAELPLFLRSPEIINSPSAVFCYHQCPEFVRTLYQHGAYGLLHESQGFVIRAPKTSPILRRRGQGNGYYRSHGGD